MTKDELKERKLNILGIAAFYLIIILGVIAINARLSYLEQQKSADESVVQTAQIVNR